MHGRLYVMFLLTSHAKGRSIPAFPFSYSVFKLLGYRPLRAIDDSSSFCMQGAMRLPAFFCASETCGENRAGNSRTTQTAIALRILGQILLVVVFSVIKRRDIADFRGDAAVTHAG